jgi:DNA-binding response OmpR family regulator
LFSPLEETRRPALVVEDEAHIRELIRLHLQRAGFDVTEVPDGTHALELGRTTAFDLIVLDVVLPDIDGMTLCRVLRQRGANVDTPVLMLTAKNSESDKVLGLESGADDYLTKPFSTRELVARASALVRRHRRTHEQRPEASQQISIHGIVLDLHKRCATVREHPVAFTKHEFALLRHFLSHPGIVFSREDLLRDAWGGNTNVTERTVDTLVRRLRRKIEVDPEAPELIVTVWRVGYKLADIKP